MPSLNSFEAYQRPVEESPFYRIGVLEEQLRQRDWRLSMLSRKIEYLTRENDRLREKLGEK